MIKISDYEVHESERERWGEDHDLFQQLRVEIGSTTAKAEKVFQYLNRPLPKDIKPDDAIDVSDVLPKPLTIEQLAERAGRDVTEIEERIESQYLHEEYSAGDDEQGRPMFYWSQISTNLTCELLTINAAAEKYGVDRRTLKKYVNDQLAKELIFDPLIEKSGGRFYRKFWPGDIEFIVNNEIKKQ